MARSLPLARTVTCAMLACMTNPSNFANPAGVGLGVTALTMMGTAGSSTRGPPTGPGHCARADEQQTPARSRAAILERAISLEFIPDRPLRFGATSENAHLGASW